jgi:hypothetical protein
MGNLLHTRDRITELLGISAFQAKAYSAAGHTDFNKVSEDVLVPLFRLIFNLPDLRNLNAEMKKNFPAIDLADDKAGVAFQVTATPDGQKITETLKTFVEKGLYQKYSRLGFYIITEKKGSYPAKAIADAIQGKFAFDIDTDILDYRDLVSLCNKFQLDKASKIKRILEANFGRGDYSVFSEKQKEPFEDVSLNIIQVTPPEKLYIANLDINREEIVQNAHGALRMDDPTRAIIRHYILEQLKLEFFSGWHLFKNQLITFHDLYDESTFLSRIIDKGTIDPIKPTEFYVINRQVDVNRENVFKTLLRKTLQEQLYQQDVEWQYEEGLFIFMENGTERKTKKPTKRKKDGELVEDELTIFKRYENWVGEKESSRAVLEKFMKTDSPDEVWYYKHRAFEARFKHISGKWFLLILPDWFFSYDGFNKSGFHGNDLKWLKRKANTGIVFTDFRFIHFFLKNGRNALLRGKNRQFLQYGNYVTFENAPFLYDEAWNPPEEKKKKKKKKEVEEVIETEEIMETRGGQDSLFDL